MLKRDFSTTRMLSIKALWLLVLQKQHSLPCQECWASKGSIQFLLCESNFLIHPPPYCFLSSEGKWQIETIQCHPINFSLTVPPDRWITKGVHVLIVAKSDRETQRQVGQWKVSRRGAITGGCTIFACHIVSSPATPYLFLPLSR